VFSIHSHILFTYGGIFLSFISFIYIHNIVLLLTDDFIIFVLKIIHTLLSALLALSHVLHFQHSLGLYSLTFLSLF
jgi:hypothetical protein